ncbi:MAG TPA: hypothetical protein VKX30_07585 [Flavobacteriaceae bacterium]|nr:hypothetical protein [Flavobacteriaceae bacterium]
MKKLGLFIIAILFLAPAVNAQVNQDIKLGVSAGLPLGDVKDYSSFNLSVDAAYLFEVADMVYVGPLVGYSHHFAKEYQGFKGDDIQHLPIAASGRINFGLENAMFFGADLGYAVGITSGLDGGIYYRPKVGYDFGGAAVILSYTGIDEDNITVNSLNLGVEFSF